MEKLSNSVLPGCGNVCGARETEVVRSEEGQSRASGKGRALEGRRKATRASPPSCRRCWQRHPRQLTLPARLLWKLWKPRAYPSAEERYWLARSAGSEDQRLGG